ncbi:MAG: hypothetical protein ACK4MV_16200 [Beijerinckiaceae bacterium]
MAKRREVGVVLPPDVHTVRVKGRLYFYHQVGRNTPRAGVRTSLGSDPGRVWENWRAVTGAPAPDLVAPDSFAALVAAFKDSPEWAAYSDATRRDYSFYLEKMQTVWGALSAAAITPAGTLALRDSMRSSPGSANHMLIVGKTLFKWGVPRNFSPANPFREVAPIPTEDDGHRPWPDWAVTLVLDTAPPDLRRFIFLAQATGQRESDVVRMGPGWREGRGLWVRPQKTRKRRRAFFVPLTLADAAEIDGWGRMTFAGHGRWGREVVVEPGEAYVLSPAGNPYTPEGLRSRWNRWLETADGRALVVRWAEWERALRRRDGEDVPDVADLRPSLHGLRATAVCARRLAGYSDEDVANDIGMSLSMVKRYSRFIDQKHAAETNIVRLERVDRRSGNTL